MVISLQVDTPVFGLLRVDSALIG